VHVRVEDGLAGAAPGVDDHPVGVGDSLLLGDVGREPEDVGEVVTGGLVGDRSATGGIGPAAAEDDLPSADINGDTRKRPVARRQGPSSER